MNSPLSAVQSPYALSPIIMIQESNTSNVAETREDVQIMDVVEMGVPRLTFKYRKPTLRNRTRGALPMIFS